ncbi:methionine--tRNA ligase [Candidatus Saccharibacteria bacterium]|nr:methionine--tRNA ligase [Candidatus Saccharibacteria bacterium]
MAISIDEFKKIELKVGKVLKVEEVDGLDKLYKLSVDIGEGEPRNLLAGVKEFMKPQELEGKSIVVVANLEPKEVKGIVSEGMLLAADEDGRPILLTPEENVAPGTPVR